MATINQSYVTIELQSAAPIIKQIAEDIVRKEYFTPATRQMRQDFEDHVITQEIDAGMNYGNQAGNPSDTLAGNSPKNLFSFIGFDAGTHPTNAIRNRLKESSEAGPEMITLPVKKRRFIYEFEIRGPDLDKIYAATPMPWAGGLSWAEGIEQGIPGLSRFIPRDGSGRSGGGIQAKVDFRNGQSAKSKPTPYLSEIVKKFIEKFN